MPRSREERRAAIAAYKGLLREFIDRRPSGLRGRLARALGKHKSFVSQITNPAYDVPIPAGDLPVLFEVCHLTPDERRRFLELYEKAHPRRATRRAADRTGTAQEIRISLPAFGRPEIALEVEAAIREFAARVIRVARLADTVEGKEDQGGRR